MLKIFNYVFSFSALLIALPLYPMISKNTYFHVLPADVLGIANKYCVRNFSKLEDLYRTYEIYTQLELPYKSKVFTEEFELFLKTINRNYLNECLLKAVLENKENLIRILLLVGSIEIIERQRR